jgi:hypothetical protein
VSEASVMPVAEEVARALAGLDFEEVRTTDWDQNEFIYLERAPTILALYRAPAFIEFLRVVTGESLQPCPESDPHSCALCFYTEPGDHIGFHADTSSYRSTRYTVLLGLIERSQSRLVSQLFKDDPRRRPLVEFQLAYVTDPSTSPIKRFVSNLGFGFRARRPLRV